MSLTMAQGMKRLGMPIAALLGVVLIGLIAMSWLLNRDALRAAVEAQIRAVTGLDLVVNGPIDVSVFPGSYVSFHDVGLKGGATSDPALAVDVLTANLRLLPLLLRRFEIADVMMLRPHIRVTRDAHGESNWTPFIETIARNMKPGADNQVSFSEIRIQDGVLSYEDAANRVSENLDDIDLSLAWPSISRSFAATGQFDWRGERVDGSISASDFVAALSGDRSGVKARLASAPLKLAFDGSLAHRTDALDFTPYISTFRLLASGARDWNRQLFDLNSLSTTDLDMRLSAARVTVGPSKLGRTALGANLRGGALALSIGEAQMYGGIAKGSFGIARSDAVADVKAQFQFTDVDLQACASELFGVTKLSGRGNLNVSLVASGSSPFGLAQSLDGTASLTGHDGAIAGFNVEHLLKRLDRRPRSVSGHFRQCSTPYDNLNVAVKFADGVATAEDVRIEGPAARISLTGNASVPNREYDLKGVASLTSTPSGDKAFDLPFVVQGPWDDPLVFPDPDILIRRSPGAAQLLESVKDRKTRDAVRSVIERFTGGGKPAAPDAPGPAPAPAAARTAEPH